MMKKKMQGNRKNFKGVLSSDTAEKGGNATDDTGG